MKKPTKCFRKILRCPLRPSIFAFVLVCAPALMTLPSAQAQTFSVIHTFTGGGDGWWPYAGLTIDQAGNLYGTTSEYGAAYSGTAFEMKRKNGAWIFSTLSDFSGSSLARIPQARLIVGPGGALYGTTLYGGTGECTELGCGSVYSLRPPQTICRGINCPWSDSSVYPFPGSGDIGNQPGFVDPVFDAAGNLYGTTIMGGANFDGNVFQLTRSNGGWTATSIHDFDGSDGMLPQSGLILDPQGNVYGTAWQGGPNNKGSVYRLTHTGSGWTFETLYAFPNASDGSNPVGALVRDGAGNLYGSTFTGGVNGGGTVFELSPSGGGWNFTVLYSFSGTGYNPGPLVALTLDAAGNLYGTTYLDGAHGFGSVFKLTNNHGSWSHTDLHDFTNGADGSYPISEVVMDASGNLYGTASQGGNLHVCGTGCGVVWEITP